jgi:hypothetical protein
MTTVGHDAAWPEAPSDSPTRDAPPEMRPPPRSRTPTIADKYVDLLRPLNSQQRHAMILRLTFGFYEGWQPSRNEMADLVAVELGTLSTEDAQRRQQQRNLRVASDRGHVRHQEPPGRPQVRGDSMGGSLVSGTVVPDP